MEVSIDYDRRTVTNESSIRFQARRSIVGRSFLFTSLKHMT